MWKKMKKIFGKKIVSTLVLLLLITATFVSLTGHIPIDKLNIVKAGNNWEDSANNASAWHNDTYLNVTIESKYPRILWYDIQKYNVDSTKEENDMWDPSDNNDSNWTSIRNTMVEVDNATWLRIVINISSDQGWDNIDWINISGWHDNGSDSDGTGYNTSGNHGSNRNFFLSYENLSGTAYYNISWPTNRTELTKGNFTESNVTDNLRISTTHTHNLTFKFKPGYQFRYAPGPDGTGDTWTNWTVNNTNGFPETNGSGVLDYETTCWTMLNNTWSWNFNVTVTNAGEKDGAGVDDYGERFSSWVLDEFGVYSYTEIVSAGDATIMGAPGNNYSTNGSNPFHQSLGSQNVTVRTRSNGNYSLVFNISDLRHVAYDDAPASIQSFLLLDNDTIWVRGGNRTVRKNFSDSGVNYLNLYGNCNYATGVPTSYEVHEVNGTCKYTGENSTDDEANGDQFPNDYNETADTGLRAFNSQNALSHYIEFTCNIPSTQWAGKYSTHIYYHLRTETMP